MLSLGLTDNVDDQQYFGTPVQSTGDNSVSYELSSGRDSLVTSILSVGTFVGALCAFPIGDKLGRRYGIMAYLVLFTIGFVSIKIDPMLCR